jgi:biopolymer transport protein ExbD
LARLAEVSEEAKAEWAVAPQANDVMRRRYGAGEMRLERSREVDGPTVTSITITRDGTLMLDGEPLDVNQLTAKLKEQPEQLRARTTVAIHTNEEVEFSRVMSVIEACQEAGVSSFNLRTK